MSFFFGWPYNQHGGSLLPPIVYGGQPAYNPTYYR